MKRSQKITAKQLKLIHDKYLTWIKQYEALFASEKYALMHFSGRKQFNMQASIQLKDIKKTFKKSVWILEVWLNSHLQWNIYLDRITKKIKSQINMLSKTTEFIWSFFLIQIHQVYITVIQSALIYEIITWH